MTLREEIHRLNAYLSDILAVNRRQLEILDQHPEREAKQPAQRRRLKDYYYHCGNEIWRARPQGDEYIGEVGRPEVEYYYEPEASDE